MTDIYQNLKALCSQEITIEDLRKYYEAVQNGNLSQEISSELALLYDRFCNIEKITDMNSAKLYIEKELIAPKFTIRHKICMAFHNLNGKSFALKCRQVYPRAGLTPGECQQRLVDMVKNGTYYCKCDTKFADPDLLHRHLQGAVMPAWKVVVAMSVISCHGCQGRFNDEYVLQMHYRKRPDCLGTNTTLIANSDSAHIHHLCPYCMLTFGHKQAIDNHVRLQHMQAYRIDHWLIF